jgi:hypothetical protein
MTTFMTPPVDSDSDCPRGMVARGTGGLTDDFPPPYGPVAQPIVDSVFAGVAASGDPAGS